MLKKLKFRIGDYFCFSIELDEYMSRNNNYPIEDVMCLKDVNNRIGKAHLHLIYR